MRVKFGQDLATGILFIVIGLGALWIGADYPMGTAQRPGTGVLPRILSWCLIGSGGLLAIKSMLAGDTSMGDWAWRQLALVSLAVVAFGMCIDSLGLVITMIISLTLCAAATPETRWPEFAVFLAIMIAIGWGTFIWLLGMPIPTWPTRVPDWLAFVLR